MHKLHKIGMQLKMQSCFEYLHYILQMTSLSHDTDEHPDLNLLFSV